MGTSGEETGSGGRCEFDGGHVYDAATSRATGVGARLMTEWRGTDLFGSGKTGLDYADPRYYAASYGRFNTADQYQASAGPADPGSWNRYAYVGGDPVNFADPGGRDRFSCAIYGSRCDSAMTDCGLGVDGPANGLFSGLDPIAMVTCSGYSPIWPVDGFAGSSLAPQCPLVGLVGVNYKTDPNSPTPVHVLFAPGVAAALDAVFATLNTKRPERKQLARDLGNFAFGAVLQSLGFSYYQTHRMRQVLRR